MAILAVWSVRTPYIRAGEEGGAKLPASRVIRLTEKKKEGLTAQAGANLISLNVRERPLKQVLDYLSTVSNINIKALDGKTERLLVTLSLENVTYRAVLDFIAKKYRLQVDDSRIQERLILVSTPEQVSMVFRRADIRDVINTIAIQANANIVVGPEVTGEISMRLENVPWRQALEIVVKTLDFVTVKEANDTIRITTPNKLTKQLETRIFRLAYLTPEGTKYTATIDSPFATRESSDAQSKLGTTLIDMIGKIKSEAGQVAFVKRSNAVVVTDTATKLNAMEAVINKLDIAPKQVHVSVKIADMSDNDTERLGVNWANGFQFQINPLSSFPTAFPFDVTGGLTRGLLGDLAVGGAQTQSIDRTTGAVVTGSDIFNLRRAGKSGGIDGAGLGPFGNSVFSTPSAIQLGTMGFGATNLLLELLRTKTSTKIIQSPQLLALDNEEATIQVGDIIRYAEEIIATTEGGGTSSGFQEASNSPIDTGIQLLIIPHVTGPENNILMTVIPKKEDFLRFDEFTGANGLVLKLPQTRRSIVVTKMLLRNGETGTIGGLREKMDVRTQNHLPIFSRIPILGRLFKHRSQTVDGRNLIIFVTPTIVDLARRGEFKKEMSRIKNEVSKPWAPLGEEEEGAATPHY